MKIVKPMQLGVMHRCFEHARKKMLGVSVLAFVDMDAHPTLLLEQTLWPFLSRTLGPSQALEHGIPKVGAEYLVIGAAHAPGGAAVQAIGVGVQFGPLQKRLVVHGERRWEGRTAGAAAAFRRVPLDWSHAYGGPRFAANPLGRGHADDPASTQLPCVEYPERVVVARGDIGTPAGFGPIDIAWPQRAARAGTHDRQWLETLYPGFARDIDWRHFNLAPEDQWLERPAAADEAYALVNLHPAHPRIEGRLPGVVARAFVQRNGLGGTTPPLEEVSLALRTAAFFPEDERIVLVYQGALQVEDEQASDIAHLMVGADALGRPREPRHYRGVLARRLDKEEGAYHLLDDTDLTPQDMRRAELGDGAAGPENPALERALARAEAEIVKARERVASHGLDPDRHAPALPSKESGLPVPPAAFAAHMNARMAQAQAEGQAQWQWAKAQDVSIAETMKNAGHDFALILKERGDGHAGPPGFSAKAQIDEFRALSQRMHAMGEPVAEIDDYLADPKFHQRHAHAEASVKDGYRITAHHQPAPAALSDDASAHLRKSLCADHAAAVSLAGRNLIGADLRQIDLHGADLSGALLDGADLRKADLSGCNLAGAVLARAQLDGAVLHGANLSDANLGAARLVSADLGDALLAGATLAGADLTHATLAGARFDGADVAGARFARTDFSGAAAADMVFVGMDFSTSCMRGAVLPKCVFLDCTFGSADFSDADLSGSAFLNAGAAGAVFKRARMARCVFVAPAALGRADFDGADLSGVNLREAVLRGARMEGALLAGADLSGAQMSDAWLYQADARGARFVAADLTGAVLANADLRDAVLERAVLRGADLRQANLFQADLARMKIDTATRWEGRLAIRARVYPRLTPEEMSL